MCMLLGLRLYWAIPLNRDTSPVEDNLIWEFQLVSDLGRFLRIANVCPRVLYQ